MYSTGEMGTFIKEQSLYTPIKGGVAVITGCAHPGISQITSRVRELGNSRPATVLGGFHMGQHSESETDSILRRLKELGIRRAGPCHCSGERTREMFADAFDDGFIEAEAGSVIRLEAAT